jgi:thioredoxin 1
MITNATAENFDDLVLNSERPVLVDFWAEWCGPCKIMAPILDEIGNNEASEFDVVKVDVDEFPELGNRYNVRSIPTLAIFSGGVVRDTVIGAQPKVKLLRKVDEALNGD